MSITVELPPIIPYADQSPSSKQLLMFQKLASFGDSTCDRCGVLHADFPRPDEERDKMMAILESLALVDLNSIINSLSHSCDVRNF